jgi:hypothetical protein
VVGRAQLIGGAALAGLALASTCIAVARGAEKKSAAARKAAPAAKKKRVELHLRALDAARRQADVDLLGASRVPAPNLFTFTDVRDRHFVAVSVHCDEPTQEGVRACRLEIPAGYETHKLRALVLHVGGLHGRVVAVPDEEIASAQSAPAPDGGARD